MTANSTPNSDLGMVTGLFMDRDRAERAYQSIVDQGYNKCRTASPYLNMWSSDSFTVGARVCREITKFIIKSTCCNRHTILAWTYRFLHRHLNQIINGSAFTCRVHMLVK